MQFYQKRINFFKEMKKGNSMRKNDVTQKRKVGRPKEFDRGTALEQALQVFWEKGYELASVTELCTAMNIKAPSLYASFGNKTQLFLLALEFYENKYWGQPARDFLAEPDVFKAVREFFEASIGILYSRSVPCGCMTVTAAVSISDRETEIHARVQELRRQTVDMFYRRFERAVRDGQIAKNSDTVGLAHAMNTLLEGLSIQAKSKESASFLQAVPLLAVRMLESRA